MWSWQLLPIVLLAFYSPGALNSWPQQPIATTTKLVAMFSALERQLMTAAEAGDEARMRRLVGGDFDLWTPEPPGDPVPLETWLESMRRSRISSFEIRQMAARSLGADASLVSFVLLERSAASGPQSTPYWIVDLWQKQPEGWKLITRYRAKTTVSRPTGDIKPSGKR